MKWQGSTKDPGNRPLTGSLRGEFFPKCVDLNSVFFEFTGGFYSNEHDKTWIKQGRGMYYLKRATAFWD